MRVKPAYTHLLLFLIANLGIGISQEKNDNIFIFKFSYQVLFSRTGKTEAWIPLPASNAFQKIDHLNIQSPRPYRIEKDSVYTNTILHLYPFTVEKPETLTVTFKVQRREVHAYQESMDENTRALFLQPYQKVPLDPQFRIIADSLLQFGGNQVRRIYDFILNYMEYDKSGFGWGQGDARYACAIGRGNCTDYHSFFNALIRSEYIPARFNIGFSIPADSAGIITGYHCWTEYYDSEKGWIPVDISEADRHPQLIDYYFGHLDNRRVTFTVGRDIPLPGAIPGDKANFLVYPYVKINKSPSSDVETRFFYKLLPQ